MLILLLLLIIIIIITLNTSNTSNTLNTSIDHFNNIKQQKCACLRKSQIRTPKFNRKAYDGNNWHLRFPYMVTPRYSYDDNPNGISTIIQNYAIIKELPINVNKYYNCDT